MKVKLFSDIHLEFAPFDPGEGEVLILAGDICTAVDLKKNNTHGKMYREFFDRCSKNFDRVFYVAGNHEHYHYAFDKTHDVIREFMPENVRFLENETEHYNGWDFVGSTLWTNFGNSNALAMLHCENMMNDYRTIRVASGGYRRLLARDVLKAHNESIYKLEEIFDACGSKVFMISHHGPSFQCISPGYRDPTVNCAYASHLDNWIMKYPQIKHWVSGHTHRTHSFEIDNCKFRSNPRGYWPMDPNPDLDMNLEIILD
jgi:predicted phosphodiesterase